MDMRTTPTFSLDPTGSQSNTQRVPRIHALDTLRGFALLGILVVNLSAFAYPMYLFGAPAPTLLDQVAQWMISFLGEVKFFVLFSFLFGYGLSVQMESARKKGLDLKGRYRRRLIGIFAFGLLHAIFLFHGDILICYSILGAFLWWMREWSSRRLVSFGLSMLVVAGGTFFIIGWGAGTTSPSTEELQLAESARQAYSGTWIDSVFQRIVDWVIVTPFLLLYNWPAAMAMFVLGLAAGKIQLIHCIDEYWPTLVKLFPIALGLAVLGNGLYASAAILGELAGPQYPWVPALATTHIAFTGPAFTFCLCLMLLWASKENRLTRIRSALRAAGRLSLTNYLGQSFICGLIFNGYGLGLYEKIQPAGLLLLAFVIFAGQAGMSVWWMKHFRHGPLEWLLRAWTYQSVPVLRRH
ncbi:MAG: DUF418 domain-containing protein [Rhodothermaceae bacterium]|nr:DUF418 domain-containing protein [Rhodothermaceae bacterium]